MKNEHKKVMDYTKDPSLSEATREYLKVLNSGPPVESLSVAEARKVLIGAQAGIKVELSGITESEKTISDNDVSLTIHIIRPEKAEETLPAFIFIHGGGWVLGDYQTHRRLVRDLVVASGCAAIFVNYSLSPEAKYPQAINEVRAVIRWVSRHGTAIGIDASRIGLVGNSAGGNMAMAASLKAMENNEAPVKVQVLLWPLADTGSDSESYSLYAEDRFLTVSLMEWMIGLYATPGQHREITISPLLAKVDELRGLPPTIIQVAENDILRDGGEALGRKLDQAGVECVTLRYDGVIHDFGMLNGYALIPQTRALIINTAALLRHYLCK